MKKILIATTNKDKYRIVTYLLDRAGLKCDEYLYQSLDDINYSGPDKKEQGSIDNRAENKAKVVKEYLDNNSSNDFDYVIGIDDGIFIKGELQENIKDYIKKILYENFLSNGEEFAFYRAYCLIDKSGRIVKTQTQIPYTYKYKDKDHFYIPDFFIPSLNLEVEIKDDGSAKKINPDSRAKDEIKDKLLRSITTVNYIKIINKDYTEFRQIIQNEGVTNNE